MTPKNSDNKLDLKPMLIMFVLLFYVWLHYVHLKCWIDGTYTDGFMALFAGPQNPYRVISAENWPIKVLDYSNYGSGLSGINLTFYALMECVQDPFNLRGTVLSNGILGLGLMFLIFGMMIWSQQLRHKIMHQDAAGKEYGSAKWQTLDDIHKFTQQSANVYWRQFYKKK